MKIFSFISLIFLASFSNADELKSLEEVTKKQIRECIIAQIDTEEIYSTIQDSSFKTYSELPKIIAYGESLLLIVEKCGPIDATYVDAEHANSLAMKVAEAIGYLNKNH